MRVEQLMIRQVTSCKPEDSLACAARLMWEGDCGCLPVCAGDDGKRVAGMITDRDICMAALIQGPTLGDLKVADAMSSQVRVCRTADSVIEVERVMCDARIRRLPVVDAQGALEGMITLADIAREAGREQGLQSPRVTGNEVGMTLASICQPRQRN